MQGELDDLGPEPSGASVRSVGSRAEPSKKSLMAIDASGKERKSVGVKVLNKPEGTFIIEQRRAAEGEDREGDLVLEEPEILPYDSVFEWDLQDPIGYYREDDKYQAFMRQFADDEVRRAVIQGMWRDRIKYQVLRRFFWPPRTFFKDQIFFGRGYYEDYDIRPTVDVETLHLLADKQRREQEANLREAGKNRLDPKLLARPNTLGGYDNLYYNRLILIINGIPNDADLEHFKKSFPNATIEEEWDASGNRRIKVIFKNEKDADAAYQHGINMKYNGKPLDIQAERKPPLGMSLSEYDPYLYNRLELHVSGVPKNVDMKQFHSWVPHSKKDKDEELGDDGKGGKQFLMHFNNFDDAKKAYRILNEKSGDNGKKFVIKPMSRVGPGRRLSDANPLLFNRKVLELRDLPPNFDKAALKNIFKGGVMTEVDDPLNKGKKKMVFTFKSTEDAKKAFKLASETKLPTGQYMNVQPQKWEPRKNTLSNYDPAQYNLQTLVLRCFPKNVDKAKIEGQLGGGGQVKWIETGHGLALEIEYPSADAAKDGYRKAIELEVDGEVISVAPKPRTGPRSLSQFSPQLYDRKVLIIKGFPGDEKAAKKFMKQHFANAKITLKCDERGHYDAEIKFQTEEESRKAFDLAALHHLPNKDYLDIMPQKLEPTGYLLDMFDEDDYQREILVVRNLPKDVDRKMIADLFPGAKMYWKENPDGTLNAAAEFARWEDARAPFRKAAFTEVNGKRLEIEPLRSSVTQRNTAEPGDPQFSSEDGKKKKGKKGEVEETVEIEIVKKKKPKTEVNVAHKEKHPPPPVVSVQRKSLSEFDPQIYIREIIQLRNLPAEADETFLGKLFPKGDVKMQKDPKGGWDADVTFRNFDDAREAFKKVRTAKINKQPLNALPKIRVAKDDMDDFERDDFAYANPYKIKSQVAQEPMVGGARPKTHKNLKSFNPAEYDYLHLSVQDLPMGTTNADMKKAFPKATVQSMGEDPDNLGRMVAQLEFANAKEAAAAFKDNHEQLMNGVEIHIMPHKLLPGEKNEAVVAAKGEKKPKKEKAPKGEKPEKGEKAEKKPKKEKAAAAAAAADAAPADPDAPAADPSVASITPSEGKKAKGKKGKEPADAASSATVNE